MNPRERAARLADDLLFPAALEVDRADRVPASHFEALAREGLYDFDGDLAIVETLASGCLATTFVWLQHHGPLASARGWPLLDAAMARGDIRGGIARAGARPGARSLTATSTVDGYILEGTVPWVTGWGMINIIEVAALNGDDVVFLFVDATESPSIKVELNRLVAVNASRTVTLTFTGHRVPHDRLVRRQLFQAWQAAEAPGSKLNGGLALGVASRCIRLLEDTSDLRSELDACREALQSADSATIPDARAAASELAMRAAITLTVQTGSRSVLLDNHAQRLVREAAFLLVFGTRQKIKEAVLWRVGRGQPSACPNG